MARVANAQGSLAVGSLLARARVRKRFVKPQKKTRDLSPTPPLSSRARLVSIQVSSSSTSGLSRSWRSVSRCSAGQIIPHGCGWFGCPLRPETFTLAIEAQESERNLDPARLRPFRL
jgi:hypothetical protein